MSENQKKILQMLSEGKINVNEAQRLLEAMGPDKNGDTGEEDGNRTKSRPRFMRVIVEPKPGAEDRDFCHGVNKHKVNIRVPVSLIRAGMKLATLIPHDAAEHIDRAFKEKGFSFDIRKIKDEDLEEMLTALQESVIDIDAENEIVKIYAE
jgi:hypothetical protein